MMNAVLNPILPRTEAITIKDLVKFVVEPKKSSMFFLDYYDGLPLEIRESIELLYSPFGSVMSTQEDSFECVGIMELFRLNGFDTEFITLVKGDSSRLASGVLIVKKESLRFSISWEEGFCRNTKGYFADLKTINFCN